MNHDPEIHHRRSIRLEEYDYSQPGAYFVTIVTQERECLFGEIMDGDMRLNQYGDIVREEWLQTGHIRPSVLIDAFVVMPNHIHGILVITDTDCRGTLQRAPTPQRASTTRAQGGKGTLQRAPTAQQAPNVEQFGKPTANSIPTIVRLFKSAVTKRINEKRNTPGFPVWQRNYYEHVIRHEGELTLAREYIRANPYRWLNDGENPQRL
ncbi:MAG TPA: transposase [bacterium]|nr:transposase [bacterium]